MWSMADFKIGQCNLNLVYYRFRIVKGRASGFCPIDTIIAKHLNNVPVDFDSRFPFDQPFAIDSGHRYRVASVAKTSRAVIVDEGHRSFGVTAELASVVTEGAFDYLDAPVARVGAMDVPVPFSKPLEDATIPTEQDVVTAVKGMF